MKNWFTSLNGVITLSAAALLSFIGVAFLEAYYYLPTWMPGDGAAATETLVMLLLVGLWLWAILAIKDGKRSGSIWAIILSAFGALIGLYELALYTPMEWPHQILSLAVFVFPVLAIVALSLHLRIKKAG